MLARHIRPLLIRPLLVRPLLVALALGGCGPRQVTLPEGDDAAQPSPDGEATPTTAPTDDAQARPCELSPGVHGSGNFETATPELAQAPATFTTDGATITVTLPVGPGTNVLVRATRDGSLPVLPRELRTEALDDGADSWILHVELAWCGGQECRIGFYAGSREPSDRLAGWLGLEGELFSDLAEVTVCLAADDGGERALTINAVAARLAR